MAYRRLSTTGDGTKINRKPGMGGRNLSADTYAWNYGLPCRNPNCKSHGKPHPNCQCYGGGGPGDSLAKGGVVGSVCASNQKHLPGCEYFLDGGPVGSAVNPSEPPPQEDPRTTLGHSAVQHGLLGLLKDVGRPSMKEPDSHKKLLEEARMAYSDHSGLEQRKTQGIRLGQALKAKDHEKASEMMQGHPLMGSMGKNHLEQVMPLMADSMMNNEANPEGLRSAHDYLHSAIKGHSELEARVKDMLGKKVGDPIKPDKKTRESLDEHLQSIQEDPSQLLDVGGSLGHYLPAHGTQLAATAGTAVSYLDSLKPKPQQMGALDNVAPPDKMALAQYHRQLDIAQTPTLVLQHVKNGTLLPQDLTTVQTLYPGLYQSMVSKAGEALVKAKADKIEIPYKQKQTMSLLLNEPLDYTQTPEALRAIMQAQGPQQMRNQAKAPQKKKATEVELDQINKVDAMSQTPLERIETSKRE